MNDDELDNFAVMIQQQTGEKKTRTMRKFKDYDVDSFAVAIQQYYKRLRKKKLRLRPRSALP